MALTTAGTRLDAVLADFEDAWRRGLSPRSEDWLGRLEGGLDGRGQRADLSGVLAGRVRRARPRPRVVPGAVPFAARLPLPPLPAPRPGHPPA